MGRNNTKAPIYWNNKLLKTSLTEKSISRTPNVRGDVDKYSKYPVM